MKRALITTAITGLLFAGTAGVANAKALQFERVPTQPTQSTSALQFE